MIPYCLFQNKVKSKVGNVYIILFYLILFNFSGARYLKNIIDKFHLFAGLFFIERVCFKTVPKPETTLNKEGVGRGVGEGGEKGAGRKKPLKFCKVQYFIRIDLKDQKHNSFLLKQPYDTKQVYL